jgi:hypothetical protein
MIGHPAGCQCAGCLAERANQQTSGYGVYAYMASFPGPWCPMPSPEPSPAVACWIEARSIGR